MGIMRPPCTERKSLNQECGWKDGDRGGPARRQGIHRKERENRKRKTLLTHTGLLMEGVGGIVAASTAPLGTSPMGTVAKSMNHTSDVRFRLARTSPVMAFRRTRPTEVQLGSLTSMP